MEFFDFFRSSAAYRCRIAFNLKGLIPERRFVDMLGGETGSDWYRKINPQKFVPALEHDGQLLTQSLAIIEYLEEVYPEPPLLPDTPVARARVRAMAQLVACDIHPLNNLRVLNYLRNDLGQDEGARRVWYQHWVCEGFEALEKMIEPHGADGPYCTGDVPGLADLCLVPQMFNARRFDTDLTPFPRLVAIDAALNALPAFANAAPYKQPDAVQ